MDELIAVMTHAQLATPEHDTLYIDAINAFNSISRKKAFETALKLCPQLAHLIHGLYGSTTRVWTRKDDFNSWTYVEGKTGSVQGCVLGPLIHGLSTLEAYTAVDNEFRHHPDMFMGAYMDDVALRGNSHVVVRAFNIFKEKTTAIGSKVNFGQGKTEVLLGRYENQQDLDFSIASYVAAGIPLENIKLHPDNSDNDPIYYGYMHLGVPRGSIEYQRAAFDAQLDKKEIATRKISALDKAQDQWLLLNWVTKHKFTYLLRHVTPLITHENLGRIDHILRTSFCHIGGHAIDDLAWNQAQLPIGLGGFGLGFIRNTAIAAFTANTYETRSAVIDKVPSALNHLSLLSDGELAPFGAGADGDISDQFLTPIWDFRDIINEASAKDDIIATEEAEKIIHDAREEKKPYQIQKFFSTFLTNENFRSVMKTFKDTKTNPDNARFRSCLGETSGAWLNCIPKDKHSMMCNEEFRFAWDLRLGNDIRSGSGYCTLCKKHIDMKGIHAFSCPRQRQALTEKHDSLVKEIASISWRDQI